MNVLLQQLGQSNLQSEICFSGTLMPFGEGVLQFFRGSSQIELWLCPQGRFNVFK
jgi:hypothetical protein